MGHTAITSTKALSVILQIWQHGAKENNCNFTTFNRVVDIRLVFIQMRSNIHVLHWFI